MAGETYGSPGAAANTALTELLARRRAERRQEVLDSVDIRNVENQMQERDARVDLDRMRYQAEANRWNAEADRLQREDFERAYGIGEIDDTGANWAKDIGLGGLVSPRTSMQEIESGATGGLGMGNTSRLLSTELDAEGDPYEQGGVPEDRIPMSEGPGSLFGSAPATKPQTWTGTNAQRLEGERRDVMDNMELGARGSGDDALARVLAARKVDPDFPVDPRILGGKGNLVTVSPQGKPTVHDDIQLGMNDQVVEQNFPPGIGGTPFRPMVIDGRAYSYDSAAGQFRPNPEAGGIPSTPPVTATPDTGDLENLNEARDVRNLSDGRPIWDFFSDPTPTPEDQALFDAQIESVLSQMPMTPLAKDTVRDLASQPEVWQTPLPEILTRVEWDPDLTPSDINAIRNALSLLVAGTR